MYSYKLLLGFSRSHAGPILPNLVWLKATQQLVISKARRYHHASCATTRGCCLKTDAKTDEWPTRSYKPRRLPGFHGREIMSFCPEKCWNMFWRWFVDKMVPWISSCPTVRHLLGDSHVAWIQENMFPALASPRKNGKRSNWQFHTSSSCGDVAKGPKHGGGACKRPGGLNVFIMFFSISSLQIPIFFTFPFGTNKNSMSFSCCKGRDFCAMLDISLARNANL